MQFIRPLMAKLGDGRKKDSNLHTFIAAERAGEDVAGLLTLCLACHPTILALMAKLERLSQVDSMNIGKFPQPFEGMVAG